MAKQRSTPGKTVRGGVSTTMTSPMGGSTSPRGVGGGRYGSIAAPFDKPQSMGNGSIPTKMMDGMPTPKAKGVTAGQVSANFKGTPAPGDRRFRNPR